MGKLSNVHYPKHMATGNSPFITPAHPQPPAYRPPPTQHLTSNHHKWLQHLWSCISTKNFYQFCTISLITSANISPFHPMTSLAPVHFKLHFLKVIYKQHLLYCTSIWSPDDQLQTGVSYSLILIDYKPSSCCQRWTRWQAPTRIKGLDNLVADIRKRSCSEQTLINALWGSRLTCPGMLYCLKS